MIIEVSIAASLVACVFILKNVYSPAKQYEISRKLTHCVIGHRAAPSITPKDALNHSSSSIIISPVEQPNSLTPEKSPQKPTDDHTKGVFDENGFIIPENTLSSFQRAFSSGVRTVELDVQVTKDNIPVVFHDTVIGHTLFTSNEERKKLRICDLTYDELCSMPFITTITNISSHDEQTSVSDDQQQQSPYFYERVTMFSTVLKFCQDSRMNIMIEIKPQPNLYNCCKLVVAQVEQSKMENNVYIASFTPLALLFVRSLSTKICTGYLFTGSATRNLKAELARQNLPTPAILKIGPLCNFVDWVLRFFGSPIMSHLMGNTIVIPQHTYLSQYIVDEYREWGQTVLTWTVNDTITQDYLFNQLNVSVITDHPRMALLKLGTDAL